MYRAQTQVHTCMIVQLLNVYLASLGLTGSPDTEQVHDAFKLVIHHFGRFLVDFFSELPRHDVLALPELAEQPLCARVDKRDRRGGLEHQDSEAVELASPQAAREVPHKQNYVRPWRFPTSRITTREPTHKQNYDQSSDPVLTQFRPSSYPEFRPRVPTQSSDPEFRQVQRTSPTSTTTPATTI